MTEGNSIHWRRDVVESSGEKLVSEVLVKTLFMLALSNKAKQEAILPLITIWLKQTPSIG